MLVLTGHGIGDAGVAALAVAGIDGAFPLLARLFLGENSFGDAGLLALVAALDAGALPALRVLHLHDLRHGLGTQVLFGDDALLEVRRVCEARYIELHVIVTGRQHRLHQ